MTNILQEEITKKGPANVETGDQEFSAPGIGQENRAVVHLWVQIEAI